MDGKDNVSTELINPSTGRTGRAGNEQIQRSSGTGIRYTLKEMAEAWNIPYELFHGRRKLKWDLERILTEPLNDRNRKPCTDHLGNHYPSETAMAEAYGLPPGTLKTRLQTYGWDLERALTTPVAKRKITRQSSYQDHKGNEYPTMKALCEAYGIQPHIYYNRYRIRGWDLKKTLTTPVPHNIVTDRLGNEYQSLEDMARAYGINSNALRTRLKSGWDTESALTLPVRRNHIIRDHKGNEFPTLKAMAKAYGISFDTLYSRLRANWDLEAALTTPVMAHKQLSPLISKDPEGKIYPTQKAMAEAYGTDYYRMMKRLAANWPLEDALTAGRRELTHFQGGCQDHKGNRYPNKKAMFKAYGISKAVFYNRIKRGWSLEKALTTPVTRSH